MVVEVLVLEDWLAGVKVVGLGVEVEGVMVVRLGVEVEVMVLEVG